MITYHVFDITEEQKNHLVATWPCDPSVTEPGAMAVYFKELESAEAFLQWAASQCVRVEFVHASWAALRQLPRVVQDIVNHAYGRMSTLRSAIVRTLNDLS